MKSFLIIFIVIIILTIFILISKKTIFDKEKMSPFECGFESFSTGRSPFSLRFFKITLIFLIFDIEIILILPIPLSMMKSIYFITSISLITLILMLGLFYEWKKGALNWIS